MKFHNGCWLFKEGIECFSPQHVYEVRKGDEEVTLAAPTSRIEKKRRYSRRDQPDGEDFSPHAKRYQGADVSS